jgi:hypothetical protein
VLRGEATNTKGLWFDQIGARTHGLLQSRLTITPPMRFSAVRDKDFLE